MKAKLTEIADEIMLCAQLAAALEVSGYPKPGNVHRTADFLETRFEDFLASSVAIGPPIRMLAWRALRASKGQLGLNQLRVGETVKECVTASVRWQKGGNTHLGSILLFAPLTAAAGLCGSLETINSINLRENIERVINASTEDDALEIFSVISETTPRTLGRLKKDAHKDILNQSIRNYRRKTDMTLLEAMQHASRWDTIADEWVTSLKRVFTVGYPTLVSIFAETRDINIAIVDTFLTLLWMFPDTFIARKVGLRETPFIEDAVQIGLEKTMWVSETAGKILKYGGLRSLEGRKEIELFDMKLRMNDPALNPGTTADLTAGSLMVALLCGWRF